MSEIVQRARLKYEELDQQLKELREAWKRDPDVLRLREELRKAENDAQNRNREQIGRLAGMRHDAFQDYERIANADKLASGPGVDYARKVIYTLVDRIERPRREYGSDWDGKRIVIARYGDKELLWWRSGKSWKDQLQGHQHRCGQLMLQNFGTPRRDYHYLKEGGRMSKALFMEHAGEINQFFGIPDVAENCHIKKTLLVSDVLPETAEGGVQAVDVASGPGSTGPLVPPVDG